MSQPIIIFVLFKRKKKRKSEDCSVSVNSDVNSLNLASNKISQSKDSSDQCDSFNDTTATYPSTKRDAKVKVILPVE